MAGPPTPPRLSITVLLLGVFTFLVLFATQVKALPMTPMAHSPALVEANIGRPPNPPETLLHMPTETDTGSPGSPMTPAEVAKLLGFGLSIKPMTPWAVAHKAYRGG